MEVTIEEVPERTTLAIRERMTMESISDSMGRIYMALMSYIGSRGYEMTGPPYARYFCMDGDSFDVECGVPVKAPVEGAGDIVPSTLPGCKVAVVIHVGPYEGLKGTYDEFVPWLEENGHEVNVPMWEEYLTDPDVERDPEKWVTRIVWPI